MPSESPDPKSPDTIREVYLCTIIDADGRERVLSTITSRGMMPMMSADSVELDKLEEAAQEVANISGTKVRIVRFTPPEVVKILERQLVKDQSTGGLLGPDGRPIPKNTPAPRRGDETKPYGADENTDRQNTDRQNMDTRGIAGGGSAVGAAKIGGFGKIGGDMRRWDKIGHGQ